MLPQNNPDRIRIAFDYHRLVANAGLLLPATLAPHLGLRELVDQPRPRRQAPGRANTARGAAHFLRETVGRVRYGGARPTHGAGRQRLLRPHCRCRLPV